jgi:prepilin-type N-terminal cleavage/methylation domain-containing protein
MTRGFTLLELIVVIIIMGILATLALTQYGSTIERTRGAEARAILGMVRFQALAFRMDKGDVSSFTAADAGIGSSNDQAPDSCRGSHYFTYSVATFGTDFVTGIATRCTAGGKTPQSLAGRTLALISDLNTGTDIWTGTGNY